MKLLKPITIIIFGILALTHPSFAQSSPLTAEQYLNQVLAQNDGAKSAKESSEGAILHADAQYLTVTPTAFAIAQYGDDQRPTLSPSFSGERTINKLYTLGLSQVTQFGLDAKLSYGVSQTDIRNSSASLVSTPNFFDSRTQLELTQSLWRNAFGKQVKANLELSKSSNFAQAYSENYRLALILSQAEQVFWRLASARERVEIEKASEARFQKILNWTLNRERMQLADKADRLQAEAALRARSLEHQSARDEERSASRLFNSLRGSTAQGVSETLNLPPIQVVTEIPQPKFKGLRQDVLASQYQQKAAEAKSQVALQNITPQLDAYTTLSTNGRDPGLSHSMSEGFSMNHPQFVVGIRFTAPLDVGLARRSRAGFRKEIAAAELAATRKRFEQDREWEDLSQNLTDARERLKLAAQIESAQKEKLEYERQRLNRGRSTTYQLLLFEQDFANSQLMRIQAQTQVLSLIAVAKTFGDSNESI